MKTFHTIRFSITMHPCTTQNLHCIQHHLAYVFQFLFRICVVPCINLQNQSFTACSFIIISITWYYSNSVLKLHTWVWCTNLLNLKILTFMFSEFQCCMLLRKRKCYQFCIIIELDLVQVCAKSRFVIQQRIVVNM